MVDLSIVPREISFLFFFVFERKSLSLLRTRMSKNSLALSSLFSLSIHCWWARFSRQGVYWCGNGSCRGTRHSTYQFPVFKDLSRSSRSFFSSILFFLIRVCSVSIIIVVCLSSFFFFFAEYENDNDAISDFHLVGGVVCDAADKRTRVIAERTSSKCLEEEARAHTQVRAYGERRRREKERRRRRKKSSSEHVVAREKAVAMGCGSCYSRTTTEMCCRLKERDGMLVTREKKMSERERERKRKCRESSGNGKNNNNNSSSQHHHHHYHQPRESRGK